MVDIRIDMRGLEQYQRPAAGLLDQFRRGRLDLKRQYDELIKTAHAIGILHEPCEWIAREASALMKSGYDGRLFWDLPPEVITMDDLIRESDKCRLKGAPRTNSDSSIWAPDKYEHGLTSDFWNGPSRRPSIRLAVFRARADDPDAEPAVDPILHGLNLSYEAQMALAKDFVEVFGREHCDFEIEPLTQKGVASLLLSDRINNTPLGERILSNGFMRVMAGWWHLYGNEDAPRCGSVTLSTDWFIMNDSIGYAYPSDGFGLSIGIRETADD